MKCPLLEAASLGYDGVTPGEESDCLKEECAWWDKTTERCAILSIENWLYSLVEHTLEIIRKMPHEEE